MTGLLEIFIPKFVKKYANVAEVTREALKEWINDVRECKFPSSEHFDTMEATEAHELGRIVKENL